LALRAGAFFFRHRNGVFPLVFLLLVGATPPGLRFASRGWDRGLDLLGVTLALAGQVVRGGVIGLAYIRRGGLDRRIHADSLVTAGLFAHSRNPLYLGNLLGLCGFLLIHDSALAYLVGVPFFALAYLAMVVAEEDFLGRRFGQAYADYCRAVPRFLPRVRGLGATLGGMRFDWRRVASKEYGTTFAGGSLVLALLVADDARRWGAAVSGFTLRAASAVWLPLAAAYVVARILKKRGRLATPSRESA
jgi:protein-S-isoprenylcysteine O-methyltransferase Ste14